MDPDQIQKFRSVMHQLQTNETESQKVLSLRHTDFQGANLTLVLDDTKESYERFSRIKDITGLKSPVILACKSKGFWNKCERHQDDESFDFINMRKKRPKTSSASSVDQSNIDGSPLKLDIIADLSLIDGDVSIAPIAKQLFMDFGLTLTEARNITSLYSNFYSTSKDELVRENSIKPPSLIVLCDGQNLKSVSCLCLEPSIDKQNNFTGVKMTSILSKPSAEKSVQMKLNPKFGTSEVLCQAKYDIISRSEDASQAELQNSLRLQLEWRKITGHSTILLHNPPLESKARVKIQVASGSTQSQAFGLYQELEILKAIIQGLATSEVNWIGTQECPLVDSVKDLVEQLKLGSDIVQYNLGETSQDDDFSPGFDSLLLEDRKDLDFTDHLWKILQNCTSYTELVEAFNYVVSMLRQGDLLPFIHSYNTTSVSRMVKDSYQGQLRVVSLSGLSPLEYLAEMGIQKLLHDYIHIFLSRNLLSLGQLEFYMKGNLKLEDKLERLEKLHNTLEVVIALKQSLHLPQATLCESTRQMLKYYERNTVDPSHQFVFSVLTSSLTNIIESHSPSEWRVESFKMVEAVPQRLVYHLTAEQPFDWLKFEPQITARQSSGDSDEPTYFLTILQDSVSVLS